MTTKTMLDVADGKRNRDAWYAFIWHSAELAIVAALVITQPSIWLAILLVLALLGWGWSAGHLPGGSKT